MGGGRGKPDPDGHGAGGDVLDEEIFAGGVCDGRGNLGRVGRGDGAEAGGKRAVGIVRRHRAGDGWKRTDGDGCIGG